MKRVERRTAEILLIIATVMIIVMAVGAVMAHADTMFVRTSRAAKKPAPKPTPTPKPCPTCPPVVVCPTPKPCPTQRPCPQPTPCPSCPTCPLLTSDGYWYAIASLFLACDSEGANWNLPAGSYISKLKDLSLGKPTQEITTQGCYLRYWENALVILNPQEAASCTIPLAGTYKNIETGAAISGSITVGPKRGKVLVR